MSCLRIYQCLLSQMYIFLLFPNKSNVSKSVSKHLSTYAFLLVLFRLAITACPPSVLCSITRSTLIITDSVTYSPKNILWYAIASSCNCLLGCSKSVITYLLNILKQADKCCAEFACIQWLNIRVTSSGFQGARVP